MDKKISQIIKLSTEKILEIMGFECEVEVSLVEGDNNKFVCDIKTQKDANFIIGQNGENLQALQHIVRLLVRKQVEENIKFILDVNSYKKDQEVSIIELAESSAKKVIKEKRAVVLRPMSAYNRRLVHMLLSQNEKVITESIGDNDERRIVIKPASLV